MLARVRSFCVHQRLFDGGGHVLVAVSGGADSVALLHTLQALSPALDLRLSVAHLNHGLRGPDAAADAAFVRRLARELGLRCIVGRADVRRRMAETGLSLEMAAREARYAFLARTAARVGADCAATGHTADDRVETVVLRLARGTGVSGLAGIPVAALHHGLRVVRPLFAVRRRDVLAFLQALGASWREDASNADRTMLRNRVRHEVLPFLRERLNPRIDEALLRLADIAAEENTWLDKQVSAALEQARHIDGALALDAVRERPGAEQKRLLRLWVMESGAPPEHLTHELLGRLVRLAGGRRGSTSVDLGGGLLATREYGRLVVCAAKAAPEEGGARAYVAVPGHTRVKGAGWRVETVLARGRVRTRNAAVGSLPARAAIAADVLRGRRLTVRSWRPGDRMRPLGLGGTKKLQDIFVDGKVPLSRRRGVPVLCCGRSVVWVPGYCIAEGWQVNTARQPAVHITILPETH